MCNTVFPPAQTTAAPNTSGTVSLTTSPSTTLPGTVGGTCSLICLFPTPDDASQVQVSSVAVVNPETNEPFPCFGPFNLDQASRRAARRVLLSLSLPVRPRRLDICAFAARVTGPIPDGARAEIQWEVKLNGTKPEQFKELLGRFHGWVSGELNGRRFRHHTCFTQVDKIAWKD